MAEPFRGRLGYGAANVGNLDRALSDEDAHAILAAAWDAGVRTFDTAPHYGLGLSERRLGAFLATKPRDAFVVSTKAGRLLVADPAAGGELDLAHDFHVPADHRRVWDFSADGIRRSHEESLERLGLERVDVLYLHDPERSDLATALADGLPGAAALRDEGLVDAVGVASMDTAALTASLERHDPDVLMVAARCTLADQSAGPLLDTCLDRGVAVAAAAVFNSGLLATDEVAPDARFDYAPAPTALRHRVARIAEVCTRFGTTLPAAALAYPLRHPAVRCVVVGGAAPEQVRRNAALLAAPVPDGLWEALHDEGLVAR
ncbi:D-threo-aldose 1-dehydrogenase [Mumia flava]|uniref:D-threo-aldose 1-dehydrogenase n=1 Tax=Mumia flava TaxID=1348852 RepID=A0A0B2BEV5_9ACTN|nr:aldo/keto reductase [Mumia flava]PJJ53712.1 D-threo-aldose 1-dehydrogenase [Mumia flava]